MHWFCHAMCLMRWLPRKQKSDSDLTQHRSNLADAWLGLCDHTGHNLAVVEPEPGLCR